MDDKQSEKSGTRIEVRQELSGGVEEVIDAATEAQVSEKTEDPLREVTMEKNSESQPQPPATLQMQNSPGIITLQWLTYAFWGWTLLATVWLTYIVLANIIIGTDQTGQIPYAIASTLVLLPLSFVCDYFFGRKETVKKAGIATAVMVIHAVIFALFGIGMLIAAVFLFVGIFINGTDNLKEPMTLLLTLLVSAVLYGFTFLRTLNPTAKLPVGKIYRFGMLLVIGALIVLAFVGPVARSLSTRDDRVITSHIHDIQEAISSYVETKKALPPVSLSGVTLKPEAQALIDKRLVVYKPEGKETVIDQTAVKQRFGIGVNSFAVGSDYKYQLCATFKAASNENQLRYSSDDTDTYKTYLSVYSHPAGEVCYKLKASVMN